MDEGHHQFVPLPYWHPNEEMPSEFYNQMIPEYLDRGMDTANNNQQKPGVATYLAPPDQTWSTQIIFDETTCDEYPTAAEYGQFLASSGLHVPVHFEMGGAYTSQSAAAGTTIFWLHHAVFDQYYSCYQINCQCPTLEVSGRQGLCNYCLDIDGSLRVDELEVELTGENGNTTIVELDENGCFPIDNLAFNSLQNIKIKGINTEMKDNIECPDASENLSFIVPTPPIKYHPCRGVIIDPQFPTNTTAAFFRVTNTGTQREFKFYNSSIHTSSTTEFQSTILDTDQEVLIQVPQSLLSQGLNAFSLEVDGEIISHEYYID